MRLVVGLFALVGILFASDCVPPARPGASTTADPLFPIEKDRATGLINARGKVLIRPRLPESAVGENRFDSGRLLIQGREAVIFLDARGREVIRRKNPVTALEFQEGLAAIQLEGKVGYIDKSGKWAIERRFSKGGEFHEGFAVVAPSGPCRHIPAESSCEIDGFAPYSRRPAPRGTPMCAFALIDHSGRQTTTRTFASLQRVSEGLAAFSDGDKWGYVNTQGEAVIPARFDEASPFSEGRALVKTGGLYGFIDQRGTLVIPAKYPSAGSFSSGLAPVEDVSGAGWSGYIDRNGNVAIRQELEYAEEFRNGLALAQLMPKDHKFGETEASIVPYDEYYRWAYIDPSGKRVFEDSD